MQRYFLAENIMGLQILTKVSVEVKVVNGKRIELSSFYHHFHSVLEHTSNSIA